MRDRGHLLTEQTNEHSKSMDRLSVGECFDLMNSQDATVATAVAKAKADIVAAIELVVAALRAGGRLIYVGAGTSGRLGVVDASECPPTFLTAPGMIQGVIAGGDGAMFRAVEGAEDSPEASVMAMKERHIGPKDVVFGIATGATTPFVHGAIEYARQIGAKTVFLACVPKEQCEDRADVSIRVLVGPEVITGSTRLKAGTATKMVLNMMTTVSMVQIGKVYGNLMVDVDTSTNSKLVDRGARIIAAVTSLGRQEALKLLHEAHGRVKTAIVMHSRKVDRQTAERLLAEHDGKVRAVLE